MALRSDFPSAPQSYVNLRFIKDLPEYDQSRPYHVSGFLPTEFEASRTNIQYQELVQIHAFNPRGQEHQLSLSQHGFQMLEIPTATINLDVQGSQKQRYIEDLTAIAKQFFEASFVLCYDCKVCAS